MKFPPLLGLDPRRPSSFGFPTTPWIFTIFHSSLRVFSYTGCCQSRYALQFIGKTQFPLAVAVAAIIKITIFSWLMFLELWKNFSHEILIKKIENKRAKRAVILSVKKSRKNSIQNFYDSYLSGFFW